MKPGDLLYLRDQHETLAGFFGSVKMPEVPRTKANQNYVGMGLVRSQGQSYGYDTPEELLHCDSLLVVAVVPYDGSKRDSQAAVTVFNATISKLFTCSMSFLWAAGWVAA